MVKIGRRTGDIDLFIGRRISHLRALNGMSQQQFAEAVGSSYQQMSKYEKGVNRLSAGKLLAIAEFLNITVSDLFDGYAGGGGQVQVDDALDPQTLRMMTGLLQTFLELEPKQQEALARVVRALAA